MNEGYIKLYRKIFKNPISEKPNYLVVWLYLLVHANHQDKDIIWNNKKITIKRGQFIGSIRGIAKHFKISPNTVKYIVEYLKVEHMIVHYATSKFSLFTIVNYDSYQGDSVQSFVHKEDTNRTQGEPTKNEKNEKNEKKEKGTKIFLDYFNLKLKSKNYYYTLNEKITSLYTSFVESDPIGNHDLLIRAVDNIAANSFYRDTAKVDIDNFFAKIDKWLTLEPDPVKGEDNNSYIEKL